MGVSPVKILLNGVHTCKREGNGHHFRSLRTKRCDSLTSHSHHITNQHSARDSSSPPLVTSKQTLQLAHLTLTSHHKRTFCRILIFTSFAHFEANLATRSPHTHITSQTKPRTRCTIAINNISGALVKWTSSSSV